MTKTPRSFASVHAACWQDTPLEGETAAGTEEADAPLPSGAEELLVGGSVLALLGAALLPLADGLLARAAGGGARIPGAAFFARWGFRHVALAIVAGLAVSGLAGAVVAWFDVGFVGLLVASQLLMIGIAVVAGAQARQLHPEGLKALGLRSDGTVKAAAGGLATYALALPTLWGVMLLWPGLAQLFKVTIEMQDVAQGMLDLEGAALVCAAVVAVVIAPLFEEIVFRGYLQPLLVQNLHAPAGIFVTSFLFALLHGPAFLPILALSMVLGWIQWRTHRTLACVVVHALHNGGMLLLLFMQDAAPV